MMAIGWRHIVADLQTYLVTGVHAQRHLRPWGDVAADAFASDGGVRVANVWCGGLAAQLGLSDGDLLVTLAGAPVASLDDLATIVRVLEHQETAARSERIRDDTLMSAS